MLYQYLANPHDHYITTIIANLRYSKAPDQSNFFLRFRIAEIVEVVKRLFVQSAELAAQIPMVDYGDDLSESEDEDL